MKSKSVISLLLRVIVAVILLQTLYFKFTGSEESVYIFQTVGMEPWGRIGSGIVELLAAVLLFVPRWRWFGAILALGSMAGAIFFHVTKLGIEVMEDGGLLFILACIVFLSSLVILWLERSRIPVINKMIGTAT